jgi:hypothetical protein
MNRDTNATSTSPEELALDQMLSAGWFNRGPINTKHLSNEQRVQVGNALLKINQSLLDEAVSKDGDTLSVKRKAAAYFYDFVEYSMGLKQPTTRSYMTIANRFSNRPGVIRLLRWRDLVILASQDDATVDAALRLRQEQPQMPNAEFEKFLTFLCARCQ